MTIEPIPEDLCWDLDPACLDAVWDDFSAEVQDRAGYLAISTLRMLTAYRVGGCPIKLRPCKQSVCPPTYRSYYDGSTGSGWMQPYTSGGLWYNGCGCAGSCDCKALCEMRLPAPIGDLIEVKKDGVVIPLANFRVDNGAILVYQGAGECPFDMNQDLGLPDTEVGTWSVTYLNAYKPTALASYAAGVLAVEFAKACVGGKCRLPTGVTDIVRAGVSFTIEAGSFPNGFTGIREVDTFIALYNPDGSKKMPPKVWSPGTPQFRHTTFTGV